LVKRHRSAWSISATWRLDGSESVEAFFTRDRRSFFTRERSRGARLPVGRGGRLWDDHEGEDEDDFDFDLYFEFELDFEFEFEFDFGCAPSVVSAAAAAAVFVVDSKMSLSVSWKPLSLLPTLSMNSPLAEELCFSSSRSSTETWYIDWENSASRFSRVWYARRTELKSPR